MAQEPVLPVHVESWVIGDHGDPPRVGRVEQYILAFHERADTHLTGVGHAGDEDGEPGVRNWDLAVAPKHDRRPQRFEAPDGAAGAPGVQEWFDVVLHGRGWAAYWRAPRPIAPGPVRLRGFVFWGWTGPAWPETRLRGRVARIQVITRTLDTSDADPQRWHVLPGGWAVRDVETAPSMFELGATQWTPPGQVGQVAQYPNPWTRETGVLVDMELDVEPDEASAVMPGAIAAHGDVLWVADRDRPIVLHLEHPRDPRPVITRFTWPVSDGGVFPGHRHLHADAAGCWVADLTGVRRLTMASAGPVVHLVDDAPVGGLALSRLNFVVAAAHDDGILVVIHPARLDDLHLDDQGEPRRDRTPRAEGRHDRLCFYRPTGEIDRVDEVELPGLGREVFADADGFVITLIPRIYRYPKGIPGPEVLVFGAEPIPRMVRVDLTGAVWTGTAAERATGVLPVPGVAPFAGAAPGVPWRRDRVWGDEPALPDGRVLGRSGAHLYTEAGRVFASAQIPTREQAAQSGPQAWWPFPGPPGTEPTLGQFWFAELDPDTLEAVRTVVLLWSPRHLGITTDGTVWMQADTAQAWRVHYLPPDHPDQAPAPWLSITDLAHRVG